MDNLDKFILETANTLGQEYNDSTFYVFVKDKLKQYVTSLNDNANIVECLLNQAPESGTKDESHSGCWAAFVQLWKGETGI